MLLSGTDLAAYIQERHYRQVQGLGFVPKLVDLHASSDRRTEAYLKVKSTYAAQIGVKFEICRPQPETDQITRQIQLLNQDPTVNGLMVQLPLPESVDTDAVVTAIAPAKDIDGLSPKADYPPATPTGILWLLAGHNLDYKGKVITVVGQGRLVGAPLSKMLADSGAQVIRCDLTTKNLTAETLKADIVVAAAGQKNLIKPGMVKSGAAVIDAAGDVDPALLDDETLKITPPAGAVGPMTVAALFDNLIRAAQILTKD